MISSVDHLYHMLVHLDMMRARYNWYLPNLVYMHHKHLMNIVDLMDNYMQVVHYNQHRTNHLDIDMRMLHIDHAMNICSMVHIVRLVIDIPFRLRSNHYSCYW